LSALFLRLFYKENGLTRINIYVIYFMGLYKFETGQFGISESGIHLLRSGYNYETIAFDTLEEIRIKKGRQISNWGLALLFGAVCTVVGLFVAYRVLHEWFLGNNIRTFYVQQFVFPIFPLLLGIYSIVVSLKIDFVIVVKINGKQKSFPAGKLKYQIIEISEFFNSNSKTKNVFVKTDKEN
jgi:hypothetical protein